MNDPGLDPSIADAASEADRNESSDPSNPEADESETYLHWAAEDRELAQFLQPARWWIASTEIPLLATWRMVVPPGLGPDQGRDISDPSWVIAVNAVSLACALIANLCLLVTMARRLAFSIAQPIVIVGWYISSLLLICILAIVSHDVHSSANVNRQLTQGYYYGAIAAALYFILSSVLTFTLYGAYKGHYEREFRLTKSQRTLMVQTIGFLVYMLLGSAVYSHIEGWRYTDAVYWTDFTLLTIGLGQPAPRTHLGRGLLFPYAFGGIVIIGIVIGSVRALVLERSKNKMSNRLIEKTRRFLAKRMTSTDKRSIFNIVPSPADPDLDEQERRRREFHAMRKVRQIADTEHRWLSLLASTIAVLTLWCIGAVIFWRAEGTQRWSYFQALYFSYTSLLTIGYGDFYPMSNWGRSFFVFWSLSAVPTMTIFISNLGDTFVKKFKDFANLLGELTILPGEDGLRERLKGMLRTSWTSNLFDTKKEEEEEEPETREDPHIERAEQALEQEQLREQEEAHERGDIVAENIHHYQYLLVRELRKMFKYINTTPPKQFDYEEWAYYLKLLGEDESVSERHRTPGVDDVVPAALPEDVQNDVQERAGKRGRWSWIGHRSPLLGDREEAEWLLDALAYKLETELKRLSEEYKRNQQQSEQQKADQQKSDDSGDSQKTSEDSQ
ncbi:Potassium channel [Rasamsonia emersonii CBS 393.64]|uniref:Potassium channel n=1 Tax=Rasamsonia emersonii (strain ATCC 16479 / CBS 393.64 / IMI 116815) TaxID=1408163 RepID=A0A0F4YXB7_RASE3|nr:Potassium channel [Rasamsonia emersonii CBS 393.64]KKA22952.1 Potassium channel [Rasamsonia emersonii CBS 393.64]